MTRKKKITSGTMRAKIYPLICECVEVGINRGWYRAHKHHDEPGESVIKTAINDSVIGEICERFAIDECGDE